MKRGKYITIPVTYFIPERDWKMLLDNYQKWICRSDLDALDIIIGYSASKEMDYEELMKALRDNKK